jgi:hypothetical protein
LGGHTKGVEAPTAKPFILLSAVLYKQGLPTRGRLYTRNKKAQGYELLVNRKREVFHLSVPVLFYFEGEKQKKYIEVAPQNHHYRFFRQTA